MSAATATRKAVKKRDIKALEVALAKVAESDILERIELPERGERLGPLPGSFKACKATATLLAPLGATDNVWLHQSDALARIDQGDNVLLTTGTGSGKSLVFQLPLLRMLVGDKGTAIAFYPQKALCNDQLVRWHEALDRANLPRELVCLITGDTPINEREAMLEKARVVLSTPDVSHAWMARLQSAPAIRRFLADMRFVVIDEAHALEGVFGSNTAYFFRRLQLAVERAKPQPQSKLQFISASATIADPADHLKKLTGQEFVVIGEDRNGAPNRGMVLLHLEGPDKGSAAEAMLADLITKLDCELVDETQVAFVDSRQGVERITKAINDDRILPYRNGFEEFDRRKIETALRQGELRACVSTSAMELGIDIASFSVGFNLGLPPSRKTLKQRAGRVGRSSSGIFVIVAPANAFTKLGMTLEEFAQMEVEPSHLYLENAAIQYQQAACLINECEGAQLDLSAWPDGFAKMVELINSKGTLPQSVKRIADANSGTPHFAYSLRQIATTTMALVLAKDPSQRIGTITKDKALREAYPGATYLHARKAYRVVDWRQSAYESAIYLERVKAASRTYPLLSSRVQIPFGEEGLLSGHLLEGGKGSIAECCLRVNEAVQGYAIGRHEVPYHTLKAKWPAMRPKYREFETTGVVMRVTDPWFAGQGKLQIERRKRIAKALRAALLAEHGILAAEIGTAHSGIAFKSPDTMQYLDDAIVIFDDIHGGLRLSAPLFENFEALLSRLKKGSYLAGEDALLDKSTVEKLERWHASLSVSSSQKPDKAALQIFAPGSRLGVFANGEVTERKISGHQFMSISGTEQLMYSYELDEGLGWASADSLKPLGSDWSYLPAIGDDRMEVRS